MKPLPELRRCPWCGDSGASTWQRPCDWWVVLCGLARCRATGPRRKTKRAAIKAWNAPADFARAP